MRSNGLSAARAPSRNQQANRVGEEFSPPLFRRSSGVEKQSPDAKQPSHLTLALLDGPRWLARYRFIITFAAQGAETVVQVEIPRVYCRKQSARVLFSGIASAPPQRSMFFWPRGKFGPASGVGGATEHRPTANKKFPSRRYTIRRPDAFPPPPAANEWIWGPLTHPSARFVTAGGRFAI